MGIGRDSRHKHRKTGGRVNIHQKKRKYEMGRPSSMTKMGAKRVRAVRGRGGNMKYRALRLDTGNFSWGSENITKKVRILDVVYNASNNELVRTKTLVKNAIVQVDAHAFKQWYYQHYKVELGRKDKKRKSEESQLGSKSVQEKHTQRQKKREKLTNPSRISLLEADCSHASPLDQARVVDATATSSKVKNSRSTSRRCNTRRRLRHKITRLRKLETRCRMDQLTICIRYIWTFFSEYCCVKRITKK